MWRLVLKANQLVGAKLETYITHQMAELRHTGGMRAIS